MNPTAGVSAQPALTLSAVIDRARATRKRAAELNTRTGDTTFPVQSKDELLAWVRGQFNGARRVSEIADLSALLLPALDAATEARVQHDCPDTIMVLGKLCQVEYRERAAPRVVLGQDIWESRAWLALPDEGVCLPGGRPVVIGIRYGSYYHDEIQAVADGAALKAAVRAKVDESAWSEWPSTGRPAFVIPDPADRTAVVPEITEACYGTSTIDGAPLVAYGTVEAVEYSSSEKFRVKWFRTRTEAEAIREASVAKLEIFREEAIKKAQIDRATAKAKTAKNAVEALEGRDGWRQIASQDLRTRVHNQKWSYVPSELEEIRVYTQQCEEIIAEADRAFAAKAENDAKIAEAEAAGMLLRRLEVVCDTRYRQGRVWVVRADGSRREHDGYGEGGRTRYTGYVWNNVSDELVLIKSVINVVGMPNNEFASGGTGVLWRPATVTREQIAATEAIENEAGLAGTFEVCPELVAQRAAMVAELHREILRLSPKENVEKVRFLDVSKEDGWNLNAWNWDEPTSRRLDGQIGYMEKGDPSKTIRAVRCAGGVLEFMAYKKYGVNQINAKWRSLTEAEQSSPSLIAAPAPAARGGYGNSQAYPEVIVAAPVAAPVVAERITFTHAGNRDFRCACGCCSRLEKSQMAQYQTGAVVAITCGVCGKAGEARKS